MKCWKENCELCNDVGYWEYIFGITFKEFFSLIRWSTIVFLIVVPFVGYQIWGVVGGVGGWIFCYLMGQALDGAVADLWNEFPTEEYPPNTCSLGIEGCKICNNEYSHEFNVKYQKSLKWYEKII